MVARCPLLEPRVTEQKSQCAIPAKTIRETLHGKEQEPWFLINGKLLYNYFQTIIDLYAIRTTDTIICVAT